jgi:hypothetical protein
VLIGGFAGVIKYIKERSASIVVILVRQGVVPCPLLRSPGYTR